MAITLPNTFSANTLIKSADVNADFSALATAIPWAANPIAAKGDLIVGSSSGVSTTLSAGAANQVLKVVSGTPVWSTFTGGINYAAANPDFEADTSGYAAYNDTQVVTITNASPAVFTSAAAHGYALGQKVAFITTGGLPSGLTAGTTYYVSSVPSSTTYQVSATLGGSSVNTGSAGSGAHTQCPLTPITGTAGTAAGLALTRSTVAPLRGTASGLITQTNATVVAGQGIGFPFSIDPADKAKPLVISFDFNASTDFTPSSGQTGSESDIEVFLQDVTNSVLIPVSPKVITANGANNFSFKGEFQSASNSLSYRLIFHCATSNSPATGFQLKLDNVFVGPQATTQGAPVTDWVEYPVSITATTSNPTKGTITTDVGRWRRVGDTMEISYDYQQSAAGSSGTGTYLFNLPSGYLIDSTKVALSPSVLDNQVGTFSGYQDTTFIYGSVSPYNTTHVVVFASYAGAAAAGLYLGDGLAGLSSTGIQYGLVYRVPIAGWSSNVQMSQDTDTRVVAAYYGKTTGSLNTGVLSDSPYDTLVYDTHSSYNTSTGRYTVPVSGYYRVRASLEVDASSASYRNLYIQKNADTPILIGADRNPSGTISSIILGYTEMNFTAGDTFALQPLQNSGGTLALASNGVQFSHLEISRISGPATIAASETVAARYNATTSPSLNFGAPAGNIIDYDTKIIDTHGAVSGAGSGYNNGWKFTAPVSGLYSVSASLVMSGTDWSTSADNIEIRIRKNGSADNSSGCIVQPTRVSGNVSATTPAVLLKLVASDYIDAFIYFNSGANKTPLGIDSTISIMRVGL